MTDLLKQAWKITKRNKILWVFGFFLTGASGLPSPNLINFRVDSPSRFPYAGSSADNAAGLKIGAFTDKLLDSEIGLFLITVIAVISIIFVVLAVMAEGAIVHGVKNAAGGENADKLSCLIKKGFSFFWVLLGINIVVWLPIAVIILLYFVFLVTFFLISIFSGGNTNFIIGGLIFLFALPILGILGVATGIISNYAKREAVIQGTKVIKSIGGGFYLLRKKLGTSIGLYFVNLAILFLAGLVLGIIGLIVFLPVILSIDMSTLDVQKFLGVLLAMLPVFLILRFIGGIVSTAQSAFWTLGYLKVKSLVEEEK